MEKHSEATRPPLLRVFPVSSNKVKQTIDLAAKIAETIRPVSATCWADSKENQPYKATARRVGHADPFSYELKSY